MSSDTHPPGDGTEPVGDSDETWTHVGQDADDSVPRLKTFGPYELLKIIGEGGMGIVFLAFDPRLQRQVAVKVLPPAFAASANSRKRFDTEARAIARLHHDNIVTIHDSGCVDGQPYFAMEYLRGDSLRENSARLKNDTRAVVSIMAKVARAIQHAHDQEVIHRDLKPSNILLDERDEPHVGDFGLAKLLDSREQLTRPNQEMGTRQYMSPEQRAGRVDDISGASDIYSLGVTLRELITGVRPNPDGTTLSAGEPVNLALGGPDGPMSDPYLSAVIARCLQKAPGDRYPSAEALAEDLEGWLQGKPPPAHPLPVPSIAPKPAQRRISRRTALLLGAGGLLAAGGVYYFGFRGPSRTQRARILEEYQANKEVDLLFDDGTPRWYDRTLDYPTKFKGINDPSEGKQVRLACATTGLLELLKPEPEGSLRFTAEVRHEGGQGMAGIYVGRGVGRGPGGPRQCFLCLRFYEPQSAKALPASFDLDFTTVAHPLESFPLLLPADRWHTLTIEMATPAVVATCDKTMGKTFARSALLTRLPEAPGFDVPPTFLSSDGIGLYVKGCEASFRNIKLKRL